MLSRETLRRCSRTKDELLCQGSRAELANELLRRKNSESVTVLQRDSQFSMHYFGDSEENGDLTICVLFFFKRALLRLLDVGTMAVPSLYVVLHDVLFFGGQVHYFCMFLFHLVIKHARLACIM